RWYDRCYAWFSSSRLSVPRYVLCSCSLPLCYCRWNDIWYLCSIALLVAEDVWTYSERSDGTNHILVILYRFPFNVLYSTFLRSHGNATQILDVFTRSRFRTRKFD